MAGNEQDLKIHIISDADTKGFQAAAGASTELAGATFKGSEAAADLGKKTEETTEKVKLFEGKAGEMKKVINEVTQVSPLLGEALRIAMNPVGGTIVAAIGLFSLLKEHIAEVNKELDEMGDKASEPTFLQGIRAKQEVLREASKLAVEYSKHIESILTGEKGVSAELTAQLTLQGAINAARGEQAKAESALEQAKIRAAQARGEISPEVAAERIAIANAKAITDEANRRSSEQHQTAAAKISALEGAEQQQPQLQANATALTSTYNTEAARRAKNSKDFGGDDFVNQISETQKAGEAARKALDGQYGDTAADQIIAGHVPGASAWATMQASIVNSSAAKVKSLQAGRAQFQADQATEGDFNELGSQATDARKKSEDNATTIEKLTNEVKSLTDVIRAKRDIESATTRAQMSTAVAGFSAELSGQNEKVFQREKSAMAGGNPAEINQAVKDAQAHGRSLVAAAKEAHGANAEVYTATMNALNDLRRKQSEFARQLEYSHMLFR